MDPPRDVQAQAVHDRIVAAVGVLPDRERAAFRCYRKHGFDLAAIANRLGVRPVEAELHLSEASGRLISALKDDAHARSLRPGIGGHPRHNLDIYHRPGDRDRLLAIAIWASNDYPVRMAKPRQRQHNLDVAAPRSMSLEIPQKGSRRFYLEENRNLRR